MSTNQTILSIQDVHKAFGAKYVHKGVTIDLIQGETLALFGGSGTGKSVILRSIIGLEKPDAGRIVFENKDIVSMDEYDLIDIRRKIGYVFQNGALFDSMTVEMNLAYPLIEHTTLSIDEIRIKIREMLKLIGLEGSENLLPSSLSGGMQKRVGVARAIIMHPKIILYDEPTAGLDPFNTQRLLDLMKKINSSSDNTSIFVTHDIPAAFQVADRVAILYNGRIHTLDTVEGIKKSSDKLVQAFLAGEEVK